MRMPGRQPSRDLARQEKSEAFAGQGVCSSPREAAGSWQTRRAPGNGRGVAGIWGACCVLTLPAPLGLLGALLPRGCTQEACGEGPDPPNQRTPFREERKCRLGVRWRGGHSEYEVP